MNKGDDTGNRDQLAAGGSLSVRSRKMCRVEDAAVNVSNAASTTDTIDPVVVLLAHMACADLQLHQGELNAIRLIAERFGASARTHAECDAIISGHADHESRRAMARAVPSGRYMLALEMLVELAYADGVCVEPERAMLEEVAQLWGFSRERLDAMCDSAREAVERAPAEIEEERTASVSARILGLTERVFSRQVVDRISTISDRTREHVERLRREFLLAGPGYGDAVRRCADIARDDFAFGAGALRGARDELRGLVPTLDDALMRIVNHSGRRASTAASLRQQFETTRQEIELEANERLAKLERSNIARQRALRSFTVAFMGRTKAGKSTLHAIVTGVGWEGIGLGAQRTTRLNRVYEWQHMRIIDTPGVGAPGGESDEQTAERVIPEADMICFVVTNDSQQESEFRFLRRLKEQAKPLLILLNVKDNLRDSERLKRFIHNPARAFRSDGPSGLQGHIERIRRYAREHYANDYFSIVPVHLLAAQMSREPEHAATAEALMRASRLQDFLDGVRTSLIELGPLRRSQTLLAGTIVELRRTLSWSKERHREFQETSRSINQRASALQPTLLRASQDVAARMNGELRGVFSRLRMAVDTFAESHWDSSSDVLNEAWRREVVGRQLEHEIKVIFDSCATAYGERVQESLNELGRDLELKAQLSVGFGAIRAGDSSVFWRNLLRWGGQIIGIGGIVLGWAAVVAAPVAVAIGVVGGLMSLASKLFDSREKKRARAVAHIAQTLRSQIDQQEAQVIESGRNALHQHATATTQAINEYFEGLTGGLYAIATAFANTNHNLERHVERLDRAYAKRILDWMADRNERLTDGAIARDVERASFDPGRELLIRTRTPMKFRRDLALLRSALQHDVKIEVPPPHA